MTHSHHPNHPTSLKIQKKMPCYLQSKCELPKVQMLLRFLVNKVKPISVPHVTATTQCNNFKMPLSKNSSSVRPESVGPFRSTWTESTRTGSVILKRLLKMYVLLQNTHL